MGELALRVSQFDNLSPNSLPTLARQTLGHNCDLLIVRALHLNLSNYAIYQLNLERVLLELQLRTLA